jgi:hypothetical protein
MKLFKLCIFLIVFLIAGCGNQGDEFLGSWEKVSGQGSSISIEIVRDGSGKNFLLKFKTKVWYNKSVALDTVPGTFDRDSIVIQNGADVHMVIQKDGMLVLGDEKFRHVK